MNRKLTNLIEYRIFVPSVNTLGKPYTKKTVQALKKKVLSFFGGITETTYSNKGLWKINKTVYRDNIGIWEILSDRGQSGDKFVRKLKHELESYLKQEEILIIRQIIKIF